MHDYIFLALALIGVFTGMMVLAWIGARAMESRRWRWCIPAAVLLYAAVWETDIWHSAFQAALSIALSCGFILVEYRIRRRQKADDNSQPASPYDPMY